MLDACYFTYRTPLGQVTLASESGCLSHVALGLARFPGEKKPSSLTNLAANQLLEYLAGKRKSFDIPLSLQGSEFQLAVWNEVLRIPYGHTRSYWQIADALGSPGASRAVGFAANRNPLAIVVPCHRVVGSNGKPGGYAYGLKVKEFLLKLEHESA